MELLFDYRYRKGRYLGRLLFGLLILIFIIFWSLGTLGLLTSFDHRNSHFPLTGIRLLFILVPLIFLVLSLYIMLTALVRLLPLSIISARDNDLILRTGYFKTIRLAWSEIESVRYDSVTRLSYNSDYRGSYRYEYLYIKPLNGRTISLEISDLNGTIDDILSDFKKLAPHLEIRGF